jgi:hypothetical protein
MILFNLFLIIFIIFFYINFYLLLLNFIFVLFKLFELAKPIQDDQLSLGFFVFVFKERFCHRSILFILEKNWTTRGVGRPHI